MFLKWCFFVKEFREYFTAKRKNTKLVVVKMLSIEVQTRVLTPKTRVQIVETRESVKFAYELHI